MAEAKIAASTRSIHSRQRAAGGRSKSSTSRGSSPSRRRRRAAALIGRTAGTSAARKIRGRRRARRAGRTGGGRRGRSSARGGRLRRARRNLGRAGGRRFSAAGFARSLGATAMRVSARRARSAARSRAEAAASAIAPAAAFGQAGSPGRGRRPAPGERRVGIQDFRGDQRHGPRPAQPDARGRCRTPRAPGFRLRPLGRPGRRENARAAAFAAAETGSPSPAQAFRLAARPFGSDRPGRAAPLRQKSGRGRGWAAGRRHRATATRRFAARPERVADGEAEVAQRGCVGVEAQDFGGGRGALQRQARARSAPAAGGSARRQASRSASPAPAANSRSPSPALPLARAQAGIGAGGGRACRSGVFAAGSAWFARASPSGAERRSLKVREGGRRARVEIGANHLGMMNRCAAVCHAVWRGIRPACRGRGDVR